MPNLTLKQRLKKIQNVFPTASILQRQSDDTKQIAKYYKKNRLSYWLFNSREGFVHMGISLDGTFSSRDFYKQVHIVGEVIKSVNAKKVLELATGKATTIRSLAKNNPETTFYGIDLPNGQLRARSKIQNVHLKYGDFHDLSEFADGSMDVIYVIEALCHATDKNKVIAETNRVLRGGGLFVVIDGYFSKELTRYSEDELRAIKLVASSMMVTYNDQNYLKFKELLKINHFLIKESTDFSTNILPSLYRLEAKAQKVVEHPWLGRASLAILGELIIGNTVAGYLMPVCVENGLFEYRYTLAIKE